MGSCQLLAVLAYIQAPTWHPGPLCRVYTVGGSRCFPACLGHYQQAGQCPTSSDPTASLHTAGATQLAGVGVALSVFNTTTKLFNVPLLSVTTSSVAAASGREAAARAAARLAAASSSSSSSGVDGLAPAAAAAGSQVTGGLSSAISSSTLIAAGVGAVQVRGVKSYTCPYSSDLYACIRYTPIICSIVDRCTFLPVQVRSTPFSMMDCA